MIFTKEDLRRIATGLKQLSIKDTQFVNAHSLTEETKFPVVQDNVNVLLTTTQLLNYVVNKLDADNLKINIPDWKSGTLSYILDQLYKLAVAPRDENGDPITAGAIGYETPLIEGITSVAGALNHLISELNDKVTLLEIADKELIDPTQMPIITLRNIEPTDVCPITAGSGMWFDINHTLQYRNGNANPPEDVEIGTPVDMLYYYNGNAYKYDQSTQKFTKVGDVNLEGYTKVDENTGRLGYDMMPWTVLIGMTTPTAQVLNRPEEFCYYNAVSRKIVYHKANRNIFTYEPKKGIIYLDTSSGNILTWTGDTDNPWNVVGGSQVINNKADLQNDVQMLSPTQWPKVIINNIDDTEYDEEGEGDVIYNTRDRKLYYLKNYDDNAEPVLVSMGTPQKGTVYCLKSNNALYRWNGNSVGNPWTRISSGSTVINGSNVSINGSSLVINSSNGSNDNNGNSGQDNPDTPVSPNVTSLKVYHVDIEAHNITQGLMQKNSEGHYTQAQYDNMYNNAVGFTEAFQYAYASGYSKVVIPKGDYCFTPIFNKGNANATLDRAAILIWIINMSDLEIDMNGSTFHLLVDSTEHSSYYNAETAAPYSYACTMIGIGQAKNITIRNGNFRGDWYTRNFTRNHEVNQESCYGIKVGISSFTHNISLIDLDGCGFSGDFITSGSYAIWAYKEPFWDGLYNVNNSRMKVLPGSWIKGVMNYGHGFEYSTSGIIKKTNGTKNKYGLSGIHDVGNWFNSEYNEYPYIKKEAQNREYSIYSIGGTIRMANCYAQLINVLTYADYPNDPEELPLRIIKTGYCESFQLFDNERYIRFQFLYEDGLNTGFYRSSDLSDLDKVNNYFGTNYQLSDIPSRTNAPNETPTEDDVDPNIVITDEEDTTYSEIDESTYDEESSVSSNCDAGGKGPRIGVIPRLNDTVLIEGCHIHDNGRGGISGGANNVVIRRCEFMKQQYFRTAAAQGHLPVYTNDNTNYHIDYEDGVSNRVTIENCVFYSGKGSGKLLFPTVLRIDFRNNICFGCIPTIGNNLLTNIENNSFHGTAPCPIYDNWLSGNGQSVSKLKMIRVMNYTNNNYYKCTSPKSGNLFNTIQRFTNCYLEIDDGYNVEVESSDAFMSTEQHRVFDNCFIRFNRDSSAYFAKLINSRVEGGTIWRTSYIENCDLVNSAFFIVSGKANPSNTAVDMYVKNVRGLDLRSHCRPPQTYLRNKNSNGIITDPRMDYVVHYENCEIDVSKADDNLFSYNSGNGSYSFVWTQTGARWYKDIILKFDGCKFSGTPSTITFDALSDFSNKTVYHDTVADKYYFTGNIENGVVTLSNECDMVGFTKCGLTPTYSEEATASLTTVDRHDVKVGSLSITNPHNTRVSFNRCHFDLDTSIFAGSIGQRHRYFEFSQCTFKNPELKLSSTSPADVICGGDFGPLNKRPKLTKQGSMYFDTTNNRPIWRKTAVQTIYQLNDNPVKFVDASGNEI